MGGTDGGVNKNSKSGYPGIGAILAVSSAKGGVGKSTVTVNLAVALSALGKRVGILDADILGPSIPGMLGIDAARQPAPQGGGKVVPPAGHGIKAVSMALFSGDDQPMMLRGPMVGKYLNLFLAGVEWGELDILLLDMPPGTGDIQLNIAQGFPLAGAIIVTTPQAVSTKIARRGARMFEAVSTPILGIVENMRTFTCPTCGSTHDLFGHGGGERLAAELAVPFLAALPLDPKVIEGGDEGRPAALGGEGPTAHAYTALASRVAGALADRREGLGAFRWRWEDDSGAPPWNEDAVREDGAKDVPVGLRKADGHRLSVLWQDGSVQPIAVRDLRLSCGCALCRDEMTGRPLLDPASVPADIVPVEIRSIGAYALGLTWSDGHSSGIHPFKAMRAIPDAPETPAVFPMKGTSPEPADADDVLDRARAIVEKEFNPRIASHGGRVTALAFADGRLEVSMSGGCQGCAASAMTLRQGLLGLLRQTIPDISEIVDRTDHAAGTRPYL